MTWKLIEALTGIVTGDEHRLNGHQWDRTVSVKTHFPHEHGNNKMGMTTNEQFPRAVLLLRHPKDAIPSYFNYLYEVQHNLPGHSTRAPIEDWVGWRDRNFEEQMIAWAQHADFWLSRYSDDPEKILVLGFEGLTDDRGGPASALGLAAFLDRSNGIDTIDPEAVPCIWDKIVRYKEGEMDVTTPQTVGTLVFQTNQETGVASKRASGDGHDRPYTEQQLEKMLGLGWLLRLKTQQPMPIKRNPVILFGPVNRPMRLGWSCRCLLPHYCLRHLAPIPSIKFSPAIIWRGITKVFPGIFTSRLRALHWG